MTKYRFISEKTSKKFPKTILKEGDLVLSVRGTIGKVGIIPKNLEGANMVANLIRISTNRKKCNPFFLLEFFLSRYFHEQLKSKVSQTTIKTITSPQLKSIEIKLPTIKVQNEYVTIFNDLKKLFQSRSKAIFFSNMLMKATFFDMFGDPLQTTKFSAKPISEISIINPPKKEINGISDTQMVSFLPMASVSEKGRIIEREERKIAEIRNGYTYFKENDVLFAKITPCMENGKITIAKNLKNGIGFGSTEFYVFRPKDDINNVWLYHLLRMENIRELAETRMRGTAGQQRVPKDFFQELKVPIPPKNLQDNFEKFANSLEKYIVEQELHLEKIKELYDSFVHKVFSISI